MTNYLESALSNPNRNDASRRLSTKMSTVPKLLVEGKFDRKLLKRKWNADRDDEKQIDVIWHDGGKEEVVLEFQKKEKKSLLFALVDMDYDFEGRFLIDRRMIDTRPLVTLASHYFAEESSVNSHIRRIINEYSPNYLYKKLIDETIDCIRKVAVVLTWIKLYKGSCNVSKKNNSITWNDINTNLNEIVLLQDHIAELVLDERAKNFKNYVAENQENLETCGINDHALLDSICLWIEKWFSDVKKDKIDTGYFQTLVINKACDMKNDFANILRQRILRDT
jgi:hypothetical protein